MSNKTISMIAMAAAIVLTGAMASAGLSGTYLRLGVSELDLDYTVATKHMTITSSDDSTLEAWLMNGMSLLDYLQLEADDVAGTMYTLDLDFTQNGVNDWSAVGTLSILDVDEQIVLANIATTDVYISASYELTLMGDLTAVSPNAGVLVPSVYAWDMTNGTDTIEISNATSFNTGAMINTQFTVFGGMTEDEFFTGDSGAVSSVYLPNGDSNVFITPVPAGVLLGIVGLGLVGVRMRKYA